MFWAASKNWLYKTCGSVVAIFRDIPILSSSRQIANDHRNVPIFIVRSSSNFASDDESPNAETEAATSHLESHLSLMGKNWLSITINASQNSKCGEIMFVVLLTIGVLQELDNIKYGLFHYSGPTKLEERIRLCSYINDFMLHICFTSLLFFKRETILKVLDDFKELNILCSIYTKCKLKISSTVWTNGILVLILICFVTVFSYWNFTEWNHQVVLWHRTYHTLRTLFIWTTENNSTQEQWLDEYTYNISTSSVYALGIFRTILIFVGWLKYAFIKDVLFVVAINMYILCFSFYDSFKKCQATSEKTKEIWSCYSKLKRITGDIDEAFGFLFKLIHLDNALYCADLLLEAIHGTELTSVTFLDFFTLAKIAMVYYLCVKMSTKMLEFRYWIHDNFENINEEINDGKRWPISVILDDFDHNSVGIGVRDFYVNESFVAKFLGIVASTYVVFSATGEG